MNTKNTKNNFPIVKASLKSIAFRRLVYGHGINDAEYIVQPTVDGKRIVCPFYNRWINMLKRAYCPKLHTRHPTYIGATVSKEWLTFSNFRKWMVGKDWESKELDKDILYPGNKHYSPKTCCFVSQELNRLLIDSGAARGKHRIGVCWYKRYKKFMAKIQTHGKAKFLGYFETEEEAHQSYVLAKIEYIKTFQPSATKKVSDGLQKHINMLNGSTS